MCDVGVRTYKISTIVDRLVSCEEPSKGVRTYKISTIVDYGRYKEIRGRV